MVTRTIHRGHTSEAFFFWPHTHCYNFTFLFSENMQSLYENNQLMNYLGFLMISLRSFKFVPEYEID